MIRIKDKTNKLSKLISPRHDINNPIYNWFSFKHSFSKDLVIYLTKQFNLTHNSWVLDPFCGGGTTLLACKDSGINAFGVDILPFSVFLSYAKIINYDINKIRSILLDFKENKKSLIKKYEIKDIVIIKKAFSEKIILEILKIKSFVDNLKGKEKNFFKLGLLSILESVSKTSKSGGFLRIVNKKIKYTQVRRIFIDKVEIMVSDLEKNTIIENKNIPIIKVYYKDARKLNFKQKFDAVITSPPYPNRHDYTRVYSLEMIFDGINTNEELKEIRYNSIRSHVEARKRYRTKTYIEDELLTNLIKKMDINGFNNPQLKEMLKGYFEDMHIVIERIYSMLKPKGKIAMVVSNVRFSGISIPVDIILAKIGENIGLKIKSIYLIRNRGNSSQQMKTYKRKTSRESIIIWEK